MQSYKYFKLQFMTLTAILIVGILIFFYFNIQRTFFVDPSQFLPEYALLIKNIKEKALEIANLSKNCEEFKYNIEEFSKELEKLQKFGYYVYVKIRVSPCQSPFNPSELPSTSELELFFSDGKTNYYEIIPISWKPS